MAGKNIETTNGKTYPETLGDCDQKRVPQTTDKRSPERRLKHRPNKAATKTSATKKKEL